MFAYSRRKFQILFLSTILLSLLVIPAGAQSAAPTWAQWGLNPQHTLDINVPGQLLNQNAVSLVYDFNVNAEKADPNALGTLLVHYQVPLVDGADVYIESKDGTYSNTTFSTQRWHQNKYTWQNGVFVKVWSFDTDWFAPGSSSDFWEPVYHAALANGFLYSPGQGGTIWKVDKTTGIAVTRINPFGKTVNPNIYTAGPISVDAAGNLYYNVVQVSSSLTQSFYTSDAVGSWLVKVAPNDSTTAVSYGTLLSQAVINGDPVLGPKKPCYVGFTNAQLPWPPKPNATPKTTNCGSQRAALNVAPAIAPDGTIYTISRPHFDDRHAYLVAVNPNMTGKWATSLRNHLNDGCGISEPIGNSGLAFANGGCRSGATFGIDPETNEPPAARAIDSSSSSPTIAPDGSILYGAYTRYNRSQGHLMHFSANGDFLNSFTFGWDSTPAIYPHGATYSVVIKDNHYGNIGTYCSDPQWCPNFRDSSDLMGPEAYFVSQLDPNLNIEWRFQNTNTQSCTRNADGTITCKSDHPNGFEWCVNAPVVDLNGVVYANSEDGNLYAIQQGGTSIQRIFQNLALGAAYTPVSLDSSGRIYSQNDGVLFVVTQ